MPDKTEENGYYLDGMVRLVAGVIRQAIMDGAPGVKDQNPRERREAQLYVRDVLKNRPKLLKMVEQWWACPWLESPIRHYAGRTSSAALEDLEEWDGRR